MIANRKGFRSYASVVTVGLFLSSTLLAAAGEVSPSGVHLLEGNEVVSFDRPGQASRLGSRHRRTHRRHGEYPFLRSRQYCCDVRTSSARTAAGSIYHDIAVEARV